VHDTENFIWGLRRCNSLQRVVFPAPDGADITMIFFIEYSVPAPSFFQAHLSWQSPDLLHQ